MLIRISLFICVIVIAVSSAVAQYIGMDTIQYKGSTAAYINIAILADGYTEEEMDKFVTDATAIRGAFFGQRPWINYANYFNIFALKVVSDESGVKHPKTAQDCNSDPTFAAANPATYFGSRFDNNNTHRALVIGDNNKVRSVLMKNLPEYNIVYVLSNTDRYGGTGGEFATGTNHGQSKEIFLHELGHSFCGLADEYWAEQNQEKPNMTKNSNPNTIKWSVWLNAGSGIGIIPFDENPAWFRPIAEQCKMRALNRPFCSVCYERIIETIHETVNPLVRYEPTNTLVTSTNRFVTFKLTELIKPVANTLRVEWRINGQPVSYNADTFLLDQNVLSVGQHTVTAIIQDTTPFVKLSSHNTHVSTISWSVIKTATSVDITSEANRFSFAVSPNPATTAFTIKLHSETPCAPKVAVYDMTGVMVLEMPASAATTTLFEQTFSIQGLAKGAYSVVVEASGSILTERLIVE